MRCIIKFLFVCLWLGTIAARADLRVLADSSLKPILPELAQLWLDAEPDIKVELNLANAATIRREVQQGHPYDIIILIDPDDARVLLNTGALKPDTQKIIARNQLVVVGKPGLINDEDLEWFDLLTREWESAGMGDPAVCASGRAAESAAQKHDAYKPTKVKWRMTPNEVGALALLKSNEVEAAFVWQTDVVPLPPPGYKTFHVQDTDHPAMQYLAALTSICNQPAAGKEFIQFLTSSPARDLLKKKGYLLP